MEDMKCGYTRVSTDDQSTTLQLTALKRAGCKTVFKDEGLSGATTSEGHHRQYVAGFFNVDCVTLYPGLVDLNLKQAVRERV
jgi:hypothetical protein